MRVSTHFNLGRTQPTLDFVDVDIRTDTPLFISPQALAILPSDWGHECVHLVQHFFGTVLDHIKGNRQAEAEKLLRSLAEPNETHLGLSKGRSRGRALGKASAHYVWRALSRSAAAKSGLLQDLEDAVLMIEGINVDIVSDMATNIIRRPLIRYTQEMCDLYEIPTQPQVASGPMWNSKTVQWDQELVRLPVTPFGKLLLVPKAIVRRHLSYDTEEYYRHYLLEHLREIELRAGSALVELLKNKKLRVTKKNLKKKYGSGKSAIVRETLKHPEVLEKYREEKSKKPHLPMGHEEIAGVEGRQAIPLWNSLLDSALNIVAGKQGADAYEKAIEALLSALFYPSLNHPVKQHKIHQGRKRVDITYTNMASDGFFKWVSSHYSAPFVFVECKNYKGDISNPELDQLSSRFSASRGQVGLLVCRQFENKEAFLQRCRDTALDGRGYIIALDDSDLKALVDARKGNMDPFAQKLLQDRFRALVS